jgi:hypothetical protein
MHDVFISYSSKDQKIADAVVNILESHKIKCWIAYRDAEAGGEYAVSIINAIKSSKVCVLIFSHESNRSTHVLNEVNSCVNHGVTIIPFRVADVMMHDAIEYYLGKTHWLDALTAPLEAHIHKLADRINAIAGKVSPVGANGSGDKAGYPVQIDLSDHGVFHDPSTPETWASLRVVEASENEVSISIGFNNLAPMLAGYYVKLYNESWQTHYREGCLLTFRLAGNASGAILTLEIKGKDKNIVKAIPLEVSEEGAQHMIPLAKITKRPEALAEMTELVFLFHSGSGLVCISDMWITKGCFREG